MKKDSRNKEACCVKVILIKFECRAHSFRPSNTSDPQLSHTVIKSRKNSGWMRYFKICKAVLSVILLFLKVFFIVKYNTCTEKCTMNAYRMDIKKENITRTPKASTLTRDARFSK